LFEGAALFLPFFVTSFAIIRGRRLGFG